MILLDLIIVIFVILCILCFFPIYNSKTALILFISLICITVLICILYFIMPVIQTKITFNLFTYFIGIGLMSSGFIFGTMISTKSRRGIDIEFDDEPIYHSNQYENYFEVTSKPFWGSNKIYSKKFKKSFKTPLHFEYDIFIKIENYCDSCEEFEKEMNCYLKYLNNKIRKPVEVYIK